jgi:PPK2 family polyphosphate:nucleotide phosphotransferase
MDDADSAESESVKPADTRVPPDTRVKLSKWDPDDHGVVGRGKTGARARLDEYHARLESLQELLYAEGRHKLLIVLQAMDTAGKDSTIRHVFQGVDPLGVRVANFRAPTPHELSRDFLWRVHQHVPGAGEIGIFNRSHYEDVLITRVNGWIDSAECKRRYRQINDFERMLAETGTTILKFYLHISSDEQKKRLEARRDTPEKQWKFQPGDLAVRAQWDDYMKAYEAMLSATSTAHAPWHVIPANSKLARNLMVSSLLIKALESLNMRYPDPVAGAADTVII